MTKTAKYVKYVDKIRVTQEQRDFVESVRADMEVEQAKKGEFKVVTLASALRNVIDMARGVT